MPDSEAKNTEASCQVAAHKAPSSLSTAQSILLSADVLNSSASQDPEEEAQQAEADKENQKADKKAVGTEHKWPHVAVNIPLPHEVIVDHGHKWHGRCGLVLHIKLFRKACRSTMLSKISSRHYAYKAAHMHCKDLSGTAAAVAVVCWVPNRLEVHPMPAWLHCCKLIC